MTDAALSYLGADDLLTALLARVKEILDADTVAVLLLDSSGRQLIATAASGLEEEVRQGVRIPVGGGFADRIAAERRPSSSSPALAAMPGPRLVTRGSDGTAGRPGFSGLPCCRQRCC